MSKNSPAQSVMAMGAVALLLLLVTIILLMAGPSAAEEQEDVFAYAPMVASPLLPVDRYATGFDESIEPWQLVRWQNNSSHILSYGDECDKGHCGFLDLAEESAESYVIASPLVAGPTRPYTVVFRAMWDNPKDQQQYGAIFSADASGLPCPGDNEDTCFNQYYQLLVRYRSVSGYKYLEYRLQRVDGHDEDNKPIVKNLTDWTQTFGANPTEVNKWEIIFRGSGHIYVKVNNEEQAASARDNKYNDQRHFGLITGTYLGDNAVARFDRFRIEKQE